jgi:hypothetical protein
MKKNNLLIGILTIMLVFAMTVFGCDGYKTINSPEKLKAYFDSKPANSPDKPIKVSISVNDQTFEEIYEVVKDLSSDPQNIKFVSLKLTGNNLTKIPEDGFHNCFCLTRVTIPKSVTSIEDGAFTDCQLLTSVTFEGKIDAKNFQGKEKEETSYGYFFHDGTFDGDLRDKYLAGGIGTYTRAPRSDTWTKK